MIKKNKINQLTGVVHPIVQAPMFGVTTPKMVAAAAKADCLGSLPLGDLSVEQCVEIIRATKQITNNPFAVNIFANDVPEITDVLKVRYAKTKRFIEQLAQQNHLDVNLPDINQLKVSTYHEQIEAIISEDCKIVSFTFGSLDQLTIDKLKSNGTRLIGTCTSVHEALILEESGVDMICVQGIEAGGHRGSFTDENIPKIGGLSLLSQVYDSINVPIIYAGGLYNAQTLLAAQTLGAQGFQVGSLLLGSAESALKEFEKQRLRNITEQDIVLTKSFSGRFARGIKNSFIEATEHTEFILPYPYQNKLTHALRKAAKASCNVEFVSIWVGQSINEYSGQSTTEILEKLIAACRPIFHSFS